MVRLFSLLAGLLAALFVIGAAEIGMAQEDIPIAADAAPIARQIDAVEARQGVASDGTHVYALDNNRIGKYRIDTGEKVASWEGDKALFPHMNSCTIVGSELACAASNYPAVPQTSAVEFFDTATLRHVRTVSLGLGPGSLTAMEYRGSKWWAVFANYDGKGGDPTRDHRHTLLVQMNENFQQEQAWTFPPDVLAKFAPKSCSGASWGMNGVLYVSGHDRPELYALKLPQAGSVLELVKTIPIRTRGQAIDWDPVVPNRLWSISRMNEKLVASIVQ
ncbi:hypothetical protein [Parasphingorhabdus cellanae]|uniref:Uncharacterized protein n=1 Tax=Parasphingorhabdus cellanae TaxID=2806553 RepID=A0ABX7T9Z7_9SPHN|nr:hypothetical protein [Parasphingorhabdus cellanae]QTD57419.1 hypothetical protein J4G78_07800 [Parasphingorhabdus cellanae]